MYIKLEYPKMSCKNAKCIKYINVAKNVSSTDEKQNDWHAYVLKHIASSPNNNSYVEHCGDKPESSETFVPCSGGRGAAKGKPLTHMHDSQTEGHKDSALNDAGVMKLQPGDAFLCGKSKKL